MPPLKSWWTCRCRAMVAAPATTVRDFQEEVYPLLAAKLALLEEGGAAAEGGIGLSGLESMGASTASAVVEAGGGPHESCRSSKSLAAPAGSHHWEPTVRRPARVARALADPVTCFRGHDDHQLDPVLRGMGSDRRRPAHPAVHCAGALSRLPAVHHPFLADLEVHPGHRGRDADRLF